MAKEVPLVAYFGYTDEPTFPRKRMKKKYSASFTPIELARLCVRRSQLVDRGPAMRSRGKVELGQKHGISGEAKIPRNLLNWRARSTIIWRDKNTGQTDRHIHEK